MKISKAFPSNYLKAADLDGREPILTIDRVEMEDIGDDGSKPVLYFVGKEKGLVLNKTNANTLCDILNDDESDHWSGQKIKLITAKVEYQGKRVPAIRIEEAEQPPRPQAPVTAPDDSDIPFAMLMALGGASLMTLHVVSSVLC